MDIVKEIASRLRADRQTALATIIASEGSTPLRPGARMLVDADSGQSVGTVGGGLVEAEVQKSARELLRSGGHCAVRTFTLTEEQSDGNFLCGGSLDILIARLTMEDLALYSAVIDRREEGNDVAVVTVLHDGPVIRGKFLIPASKEQAGTQEDDLSPLRGIAGELSASFSEMVHAAVEEQNVVRVPLPEGALIVEPVIGLRDLLIFGGGHVSLFLSRCAALAGFRVTVVDDRAEYANAERFPEAFRTIAADFDRAWDECVIRPSTSIAIVTRGHKYDERVLERAVRTQAGYIGMIGSKRKVMTTFGHLVGRGMPRDLLRNVHAPIGLAIGAMTAEEIAVSITAELIAARRGALPSTAVMSDRVGEFFASGTPSPEH
jgi:xanthine dehydrogenase accessory factor